MQIIIKSIKSMVFQ